MSNEELNQRKYLASGRLKGDRFGDFEELNIGQTTIRELKAAGVETTIPDIIDFPFAEYKPLKKPASAKPDRVYLRRQDGKLRPIATGEEKAPTKLRTNKEMLKAAEQGLFAAAAMGAPLAVTSNGERWLYVDVERSLASKTLTYHHDKRDFGPGVLSKESLKNLLLSA